MNTPANIHSIGHAAQLLQRMPAEIRERAEALGITPVISINSIDHYSEEDLQRIRESILDSNPLLKKKATNK